MTERAEDKWRPIETAPEDGHHYLAWCVDTVDEYDEDRLIAKGVKEEYACVAYFLWGSIVQFPFTGGIVRNRRFTHWRPLPSPPHTFTPDQTETLNERHEAGERA